MQTLFKITTTVCLVLVLGACTANQQDAIYNKLVNYGRDSAGLNVKTAKVDGDNLHYLERPATGGSPQTQETVVLLHGFSANKDNWIEFSKQLDDNYRLIIPDWPGHGDNTANMETNYNLFDQAKRLDALLIAINAPKVHLLGNSMGGGISMIYSLLYPSKVASLGLMNTLGFSSSEQSEYFKALERGENPLIACDVESFDQVLDITMEKAPYIPGPIKSALARESVGRCAINKKIFSDMLASREKLEAFQFEEGLAKNARLAPKPVIVIWGDKDRVLDVAAVEEIKGLMPQAQVVVYENIGHLPMLEIPEESGLDYNAFLKSSAK